MAAEAIDGEALRRAAIAAAGDARLRAMLETAEVAAVAAGARWEASHGAVHGYAVTVGLCAEDLAALDASPATRDLLERGFAMAMASAPDRSMTALATRWNRRGIARGGSYREVARASDAVTLDEALRRYGEVAGWGPVGAGLRVEERRGGVRVRAAAQLDRGTQRVVEAALVSLLGAGHDVTWSTG